MVHERSPARARHESGQAAVEAALTLPLTVFLILGTIQLFLMLQGRILAEYAAFRATRAGSLNHGDCQAMEHAAILALLPSFHSYMGGSGGNPAQKLATAFSRRKNNQYASQDGVSGTIVWIVRDSPRKGSVPSVEDRDFDQGGGPMRLETRLVYFFPMRIPFANWLISRISLARWGWLPYEGTNPLMVAQTTRFESGSSTLEGAIRGEVMSRYNRKQYIIPIHASGSMRMMTPARKKFFQQQNCTAPETL
ncbi:pilus assembly protein [Myxococcaceae bacterium GXIMD 01537]